MTRLRRLSGPLAACLAAAACATADDAPSRPQSAPAPVATTAADARPAGERLYARHCLSCHQADGGGVPNMQPPIAGGSWVKGDARALALFVLTGGFDSASRKEGGEGNVMPPFGQLPDADLAEILSYIREKFGSGAAPVTPATVAEARSSIPPK
jgi:mono/diheme cytochrome c family protein